MAELRHDEVVVCNRCGVTIIDRPQYLEAHANSHGGLKYDSPEGRRLFDSI